MSKLSQLSQDEIRKRDRERYAKNAERKREIARASYRRNSEARRAQKLEYNKRMADHIKRRGKEYYKRNKDSILEKVRDYGERNKCAVNKRRKRYYAEKRDTVIYVCNARRRANERSAMHPDHNRKIESVLRSAAARLSGIFGIKFHIDHVVALASGGWHHHNNLQIIPGRWNVRKNMRHFEVLPDCWQPCEARKRALTLLGLRDVVGSPSTENTQQTTQICK